MIHILGHKGMLGNYIFRYFSTKYDCEGHCRSHFDAVNDIGHLGKLKINTGDIVINCIGVIKPQIESTGETNSFIVNSLFPRLLADYCEDVGATMFHITTDCVYSGNAGQYSEQDPPDQFDTYGLSKFLGEPENCCVIRTSIIGEEEHNQRSLIEWAKSQKDSEVFGFTNHWWNGLTCLQVAKSVSKLIQHNHTWQGVRHVFTPNIYTKLEMMEIFDKVFQLNLTINPKTGESRCDRTMSTIYPTSDFLEIPTLEEQVEKMYGYIND